jgi:large subunit ribosomal protein L13
MGTYGKGTYSVSSKELEPSWFIVDAEGLVLGRLASRIASVLRGKHSPKYTPHLDLGDRVIVVNSEKVILTGRKAEQKTYFRHSGYLGSETFTSYREMMEKNPTEVIKIAVKGMLPKGPLGHSLFRKLKVYAGTEHPHTAQEPQPLP